MNFLLTLTLALLPDVGPGSLQGPSLQTRPDSSATFIAAIAPLLKTNCSPCHFSGGSMYDEYPFDDFDTVVKLGKRLRTRLKEPGQQQLLSEWLENGAKR
jgi:hypothetical protein